MKLILRYFKDAIKRYPKEFMMSLLIIVGITILNTLTPYGLRVYLDIIVKEGNYWYLGIGLFVFAIYLTIKTYANISWMISLDQFGGRFIEDITLECEMATSKTSLKNIENTKVNIIKHIMFSDILDIFRVIGHHTPSLLGSLAIIIMSIALSFYYNVYITLFIFVSLVVGMSLSFVSRKIIAKASGDTNQKLKAHNSFINQYIDSIMLVQTNNILPYFLNKTSASVRDFINTAKKEDKKIYFWVGMVQNYNTLFTIALSALLAIPAAGGSIINLVFFTTLSNMIMNEGQKVEQLFQQIMKAQVSFENVEHLLKLPIRQGGHTLDLINEVTFKNISFRYNEGTNYILKDVTCTLRTGDHIKLEGSNGSGKSTFIKLLMGLYSPVIGELLLNKEKIEKFSQDSLNEKILYINQDESLLNESIKDYLEWMTNQEITSDKLTWLFETVNMNTENRVIENNGLSLSTGQRKKLLFIKLLLRYEKASIVILDELGAGLDRETKNKYYELVNNMFLRKDKIFILVEHDSNNPLQFNKIYHLSNQTITVNPI